MTFPPYRTLNGIVRTSNHNEMSSDIAFEVQSPVASSRLPFWICCPPAYVYHAHWSTDQPLPKTHISRPLALPYCRRAQAQPQRRYGNRTSKAGEACAQSLRAHCSVTQLLGPLENPLMTSLSSGPKKYAESFRCYHSNCPRLHFLAQASVIYLSLRRQPYAEHRGC